MPTSQVLVSTESVLCQLLRHGLTLIQMATFLSVYRFGFEALPFHWLYSCPVTASWSVQFIPPPPIRFLFLHLFSYFFWKPFLRVSYFSTFFSYYPPGFFFSSCMIFPSLYHQSHRWLLSVSLSFLLSIFHRTMVQNSRLSNHSLFSQAWEWMSEQASNKSAQWSVRVKQEVWSKWMSEWCKLTDEWAAWYLYLEF